MNWLYTCLTIICLLLMITLILHVATYSGFNKSQKFWYLITFIAIAICTFAEWTVHCGIYDPKFKIPLTILTIIQFSLAPMLGVFFSGALGLHKQAKIACVIFLFNFLVEINAAPFGWVFSFTDAGYARGDLFVLYEIFYVLSLVYLIVCLVIVGRKFRHRDLLTIVMLLVILLAGIVPMMFYQVHVTYFAIAIGSAVCYIYYNDLVQQDIQAQNAADQEKISAMQQHIISGLANLIENRDIETGEHIARTSHYAKILASNAAKDGVYSNKLDEHFINLMHIVAPLHDIGKIVVSDQILRKPAKLTSEEFAQMQKHAAVGGRLVKEVLNGVTDDEYLLFAADVATYHHERWDGTGYPFRLKGEEIPLSARIMAIADVFDALVSERCYKKPYPPEEAFKIIEEESGTHFDPNLVAVFLRHKEEVLAFESNKEN